jgi:CO dehydrogenase maturation factor
MCGTCGMHGTGTETPAGEGRRVVVVGKGGVGKSTLVALLARTLARHGASVVAVDADEQRNLGATLGVDLDVLAGVVPLAADADYVEEKTGARPGEGAGAMLRLNPDTSDVVERHAVLAPDGVRLLVMGGVQRAGGGCLCPENALLAAAIANMRLQHDDVVLMDTHAGVEHFGRALARGFDTALVVVEPTFNSIHVGLETARLAEELGIGVVDLVVNQSRNATDCELTLSVIDRLGGYEFSSISILPFDERLLRPDPSVDFLLEGSRLADAVHDIAHHLVVHREDVTAGATDRVGVG